MSELSVGQLRGLTVNNNTITVPSGHNLYAPGHVVQVVSVPLTTQFSTSSTSFVDTGLSATITPRFNTSRIFVSVFQQGFAQYTSGNNEFLGSLVRNSTTLGVTKVQINIAAQISFPNNWQFLDSPATTSAITYKTQVSTQGTHGGNTIFLQWPYGSGSVTSTITLMEIAQ